MGEIVLKTEIPGPQSKALLGERERAVPRSLANATPIFVQKAKGRMDIFVKVIEECEKGVVAK